MESSFCYAMPSSLHKVKIEYQAVTIKVVLFGTIALIHVTILALFYLEWPNIKIQTCFYF